MKTQNVTKIATMFALSLFLTLNVFSQARVQVIHNSADLAAQTVDVWLNDQLLLDDFMFRTASPFIDAPAEEAFDISIQPANSMDTINALAKFNYTLADGETYVLIANGIVSASGYDPIIPFDIDVFPMGREEASMMGNTDVLVYHGSTDAPTVDVYESSVPAGTIVNDLEYSEFSDDYLELGTADYILDIQDETGSTTVASYQAPLSTLGLENEALVVLASGFFNPEMNSNGEAFGLYVALPAGGDLVQLPMQPLGVENQERLIEQVNIYPNPSKDYINIDILSESADNIEIKVFDMLGNNLLNITDNNSASNSKRLDISALSNGMYYLTFNSNSEQKTFKFQVIR